MNLLKLYADDVPIAVVLADLKGRFGHQPTAFHQDVADLPPAEYRAAREAMTRTSEQVARQGRPSSFTGDARTLSRQDYATARQDMLRSLGR